MYYVARHCDAAYTNCFFLLQTAIPPIVTAVSNGRRDYLRTSNVVLKFDLIDSTSTCELQVHVSNIQWTYTTEKGSETLNTSFPFNSRYNFSDDLLSLTITNLQEADEGNYTLRATNDAGNSSATYNLAVYGKKIIIMQLHYIWM